MQGVTNFKFEEGNPRNFNLIIPDLTTQIVSQNLPVGGSISSTQEAQSVMKTLEEVYQILLLVFQQMYSMSVK